MPNVIFFPRNNTFYKRRSKEYEKRNVRSNLQRIDGKYFRLSMVFFFTVYDKQTNRLYIVYMFSGL